MATAAGRSWRFVAGCAVGAATLRVLGCGVDPVVEDPTEGFDLAGLLAWYGAEVVFPTVVEFEAALGTLVADVGAWGDALATTDGRDARLAAQASWAGAMAAWQQLEVMQVGSLGSSASAVAGADVRDLVYSWPTVNACRVDQETLEGAWTSPAFFADEAVNVMGLDAVEHMLWSEEGISRCDAGVQIIESGAWEDAGVDAIQAARAEYTAALLAEVVRHADELATTWDPDGDDWGGVLAAAGEGASPYEDPRHALDQVFEALFYVELVLKDRKLAQPLGLRDCDEARCPDALESRFADAGYAHLRNNLLGARLVVTGGDGLGFDDLLVHAEREDLSVALVETLGVAIDTVSEPDRSLRTLLADEPAAVLEVHDRVKDFTDLLKGDFATVLLLDIPSDAAGDND